MKLMHNIAVTDYSIASAIMLSPPQLCFYKKIAISKPERS